MGFKGKTIDKSNVQEIIALTPMQEGLLFHYLKELNNTSYFEQLFLRITGNIDFSMIKKSWSHVIHANEMMRTIYRWEKLPKPLQIILKKHELPIRVHDLTDLDPDEKEERITEIKAADKREGIDLTYEPMRITLIRLNAGEAVMMISNHHILFDGWSNGIILKEFFSTYNRLATGAKIKILTKTSYKEFVKWLTNQDAEKGTRYWTDYLAGFDTKTTLPIVIEDQTGDEVVPERYSFKLDQGITDLIRRFASESKVTQSTVFYTVWGILLQMYTNARDVVFGTTVSGRNAQIPGLEEMVGLFINTVPLRIKADSGEKIIDILHKVEASLRERTAYEHVSLVDIKSVSEIDSKEELFDSLVVIENYPLDQQLAERSALRIDSYSMDESTTYDLTLTIEMNVLISVSVDFNTLKYDLEFMKRLEGHFKNILTYILHHSSNSLTQVEMLSEEEKYQVFHEFNQTRTEYRKDITINQLFEEHVAQVPDQVAIISPEQQLTYRELNEKANRLAGKLREMGVVPDSTVGLLVERSVEMIVGIYGILKAGAAYLPIAPEYPKERVGFMLEDSETQIILTTSEFVDQCEYGQKILNLDQEAAYLKNGDNLEPVNHAHSLAYMMYTSGSTGRPKGVLVEHQSVINILTYLQNQYPMLEDGTYLLKTAFTFDISGTEIFGWFMGNGRLALLPPGAEKDVGGIVEAVESFAVTHINFVPSMLIVFLNQITPMDQTRLQSLKYVMLCGEACTMELARKCEEKLFKQTVENIYGPTETTIYATGYSLSDLADHKRVPIGKPLSNVQAYILDKENRPVPIGVPGELCISGDCMTRGYHKRDQLLAEKFVDHPLTPGKKMYRTGDLAKWLPDGNIDFLGRMDHQVKIRGFRVELGEVERHLLELEQINEAAVIDEKDVDGANYLVAYLVSEQEVKTAEVREALATKLPDYMIPSKIVQLEEMPINTSGKLNRKALPKLDGKIVTGAEYEEPRNEMEEKLVSIWKELLEVEKIGINDSFFDLGGHSLKATTLMGRIHKELSLQIPLDEFFNRSTIKEMSAYFQGGVTEEYAQIPKIDEQEFYQTSSAQKRMYMLQQFDPESTGYNMSGALLIEGAFDLKDVATIFTKLIQRHESLRTSFETMGEEVIQRIAQDVNFTIELIEEQGEELETLANKVIRPFDLGVAPLLRVGVIKSSDQKHLLLLDMHHIISDGVSIEVLMREFSQLYAGEELPELRIQYKDFAAWQNELQNSELMRKQEEYWVDRFSGELPVLNLPTDYPRPTVQSFAGETLSFRLDQSLTQKLNQIAQKTGSTLYMVLLSGINILLSKYSGDADIIVGSPIAGRPHPDLEKIVGMFVNTLAMRNNPKGSLSYQQFLNQVKENALQAYQNQGYQFEELVEQLNIRRDLRRNPLFDVMFVLQNMGSAQLSLPGLELAEYDLQNNTSKFDLTIRATEQDDEIAVDLVYSVSLFKRETIERISKHFTRILIEIVNDPEVLLSEVEMLTEAEQAQVLYEFNQTAVDYSKGKTIHQLFEEQVARRSEQIGLVFKENQLTYQELNLRANQLARTLREKGVQSNKIVGLLAEPSQEMLISMLAILKAGGAYLPLDPEYPQDRIRYMLEDSEATLVLAREDWVTALPEYQGKWIDPTDQSLYVGDGTNLNLPSQPEDLIYVIYTSGTTGKPKGVSLEHRNLVNYAEWFGGQAGLDEQDKTILLSSFAFDLGYTSIYPALLKGSQVHIVLKEDYLDVVNLIEYVKDVEITYFKATPSLFNMIINSYNATELKECTSLRLVVLGGEAINPTDLNRLREINGQIRVMNHYGPTEATIGCVSKLIPSQEMDQFIQRPVIGSPINNTQIYILKDLKPTGIGIPGELYISGDGLAREYLNNPLLTMERFMENPFKSGERIYKTGDLARWLPDGTVEFLGRIDHQVKIRGFRVELGEIQSQVLNYESIKEAVVIDREDQNGLKYLCGYIVADTQVDLGELRGFLISNLPEYMIPLYFIQLDQLPLTANGKVNRKELPEPDGKVLGVADYEAPRNKLEEKLVGIWKEILGIGEVGITDDFFDLGGHSLKGTVLIGKIHKELEAKVPLREIFKRPTIKELASYIQSSTQSIYDAIKRVEEKEFYQVSSAQKRMYLLQQFELESTAYNMPAIFEVKGSLDLDKLKRSFQIIIDRHDTLRTSFVRQEGEIYQRVHSEVDFTIDHAEEMNMETEELVQEFIQAFDLSQAPLLRVKLIKVGEQRQLLIFDMHHIISDGVSNGVLIRELAALYEGKELGELKIQYTDYAEWQNNQFKLMEAQEEYWVQKFSNELPVLDLPIDNSRPKVRSFEGDRREFFLDEELTQRLNQLAKKTGTTLYMVLLSAVNILLAKYSRQEDIIVGSPIAGRPHPDLENMIGMFVNALALRNNPAGSKSYQDFLNEIKETALEAYENQDYQFEELIDRLNLPRDLSRNPLFDVMFVMQNTDYAMMDVADLQFTPYDFENRTAKYDLTIIAQEEDLKLSLIFEFTRLFENETIERMFQHYERILKVILVEPRVQIGKIDMLTEQEKRLVVEEFNDNRTEYPRDRTIQELFEEQAERVPDQTAVVFEDQRLTYRELNEQANRLARTLREQSVTDETIVGIMTEHSLEMIIGVVAILKAGGAYLPIDPDYPLERIKYMLEDCSIEVLLTNADIQLTGELDCQILNISESLARSGETNLENVNGPKSLAYVIYTSGSTGRPKGVLVEHRNVVRLVKETNYVEFGPNDRILQTGTLAFDASTFEVWGALLNGLQIHLGAKDMILKPEKMANYIEENQITTLWLTAPLFNIMAEENPAMFKPVKYLLAGGDVLLPKFVNRVRRECPEIQIINGYGPTENTTFTACFPVDKEYKDNIPIGKPISNTTIYIVDPYDNPTPVGVYGELCTGGDGLSRGYLNNPELTSEKFVDHFFKLGEKLYRTGDLARWLPDGNIEFLGRVDHQVKIRGFRIETGEIENRLLDYGPIKEAVVIARKNEDGEADLSTYYVAEERLSINEIRDYLVATLPEYMVPSYFMQLDQMPLNANGKIDRKKLPIIEGNRSDDDYIAPGNETEERLVAIWCEVLGVDRVGIRDNFFVLGGHSLKATQLATRLNKEFAVEIPLREIFSRPTIKEIARYIETVSGAEHLTIEPVEKQEYYPSSSAQKRVYFVEGIEKESVRYNMPQAFYIRGELNEARFVKAVQGLVDRHESLRTYFAMVDGHLVQKVVDQMEYKPKIQQLNGADPDTVTEKFIRPFELAEAPLLRVELYKDEDQYLVLFDMHHIISDGISKNILLRDFVSLYQNQELPQLNLQYKDFASWQNRLFTSPEFKGQEEYWISQFEGELPVVELPTDYPKPKVLGSTGKLYEFDLAPELLEKIADLQNQEGVTLFMVLLAVYNILVAKYTGESDIIIGTPIAGRKHVDLEDIIGMFVNTLAMRNYPGEAKRFQEFLHEVKANTVQAYDNQDYQFEMLVDKLGLERSLQSNPIFDIMLVLQNMEQSSFGIDDLELIPYELDQARAKFDLTLNVYQGDENLRFSFIYNLQLFTEATIKRMSEHFIYILEQVIEDQMIKLSDIRMPHRFLTANIAATIKEEADFDF